MIRKHMKILGLVVAIAAVVTLAGVWTVFAQSPTATPSAQNQNPGGRGGGFGFMRGGPGLDQTGLEAAAKVLGMSTDALSNQLWGGQTLAGLAEKAGVDLQVVRDAVDAARVTATRAAIEQAVTDGTIARDKADWLLLGLDKGYWGAQGGPGFFGMPGERGDHRGAGNLGGLQDGQKAPTPSSAS